MADNYAILLSLIDLLSHAKAWDGRSHRKDLKLQIGTIFTGEFPQGRRFNLIAFVFNCNYPTTAALLFQNNCFTAVGGGGGGPRG